jgi:hypothetical protein
METVVSARTADSATREDGTHDANVPTEPLVMLTDTMSDTESIPTMLKRAVVVAGLAGYDGKVAGTTTTGAARTL